MQWFTDYWLYMLVVLWIGGHFSWIFYHRVYQKRKLKKQEINIDPLPTPGGGSSPSGNALPGGGGSGGAGSTRNFDAVVPLPASSAMGSPSQIAGTAIANDAIATTSIASAAATEPMGEVTADTAQGMLDGISEAVGEAVVEIVSGLGN